ncbi:MAG: FAD binding domain-containing protein [Lachnospiraceae bacterium]|nr:FAD binding domain-containing protein [Lachnospiraceae bacterium]
MFHVKEYVRAKSLKDAYDLNQKRSNILLGGMMWLKMGRNYKVTAIDLSDLGLNQIEEDEKEFRIGCMCSLRQLELHKGLNDCFGGVFKECTRYIVGTQFRNGATVGGSVFGRYGFSDILTCMMMLDTYVELYQGGIVPLTEFAAMPYNRDILVRVIIRKDGRRAAYTSQRQSKTDFPLIACGVAVKDGIWQVSVGARPERAALVTIPVTQESPAVQAKAAVEQFTFHSNLRGSAEYRRYLAEVYVRRLMEQLKEEA